MYTELLDQLAATPKTLAHLVAEAPEDRFGRPGPEGWSARTVLAHFRDDEYLCMRLAIERMLAEQRPALTFLDGADWEPTRNASRDKRELLLADFALQRQATLSILRGLRDEDWSRTGVQGGREVTIADVAEGMARHDAEHIAQLEGLLGETLEQVLERRARMAERG